MAETQKDHEKLLYIHVYVPTALVLMHISIINIHTCKHSSRMGRQPAILNFSSTPLIFHMLFPLFNAVEIYYGEKDEQFCIIYSAGVGRTGCFILIDEMLERSGREGTIDVYNCLQYLRTRRINMVQTEVCVSITYLFIH